MKTKTSIKTKYMAKYLANSASIEAYEIISESEKMVRLEWGLRYKETDYYAFFDTWEEAHEWLKENASKHAIAARHNLFEAESEMDKVHAMKSPNRQKP